MIGWSLLLFLGLGIVIWWSFTRHSVSGKMTATGDPLGNWTMRMDSCRAFSMGAAKTFVLTDGDHPDLKMGVAVTDTDPPQVRVVSSEDRQSYDVDFDRCGMDEVKAEIPMGSKAMDGHVTLNCMVGNSRLVGDVTFRNCR
jgi:hypothetical protein